MTEDTFRTAYQQAHAELREISEQYERLRKKKLQVERIMEALRPLLELESEAPAAARSTSDAAAYQVTEMAATAPEPMKQQAEAREPVLQTIEAAADEPVQYASEPSSDPFQRRIESVLWGWSQKREGMAPAV